MSSVMNILGTFSWIFKKVSMKESNAPSLLETLLKWVPDIYKSWYSYFYLSLKGMALEKETCSLYEFVSSGVMWKVVFVGHWILCGNLGLFIDLVIVSSFSIC